MSSGVVGRGVWGATNLLPIVLGRAVQGLAPGGDEIARVDDFDMPEHHSHGP